MTTESGERIGSARVDVVVDTSQFDVAIASAKTKVSDMTSAAQAQYAQLSAAEKRRIDSLINQTNKLGLTRDQQIAYNAALKVEGPLLDEITQKLARKTAADQHQAKALMVNAGGLGSNAKSARELQFAMRGLPAQITDIFTSLQAGQRPMQVFLQQGGQLKDMFGGIRPAAKALGGALLGLINPLTVTAAVAGTLLLAWKQGSDETYAYQKALIETGHYAGLTANDLADLARELDGISGTQHAAAATLAQIAGTGKFTAEQIRLVGRAAVASGQDLTKLIGDYGKLAEDPVKAVAELNEQYHFLTAETYRQIQALRDEGHEREAATLAIKAYSDETVRRAGEVKAELGLLEKAWNGITTGAKEAWDAMLDIGRQGSLRDQLDEVEDAIREREALFQPNLGLGGTTQLSQFIPQFYSGADASGDEKLRDLRAQAEVLRTKLREIAQKSLDQRASDLQIQLEQEIAQYESREERKTREIERIKVQAAEARAALEQSKSKDYLKAIEEVNANEAKAIKGIEEKYKERARKPRQKRDESESLLQSLRRQIALNKEQLETQDKLTASDRLRLRVQLELERLSGKITPAREAEIQALLAEADATGKAVVELQRAAKAKEVLARLDERIAASRAQQLEAAQIDLATYGKGQREIEQMMRKLDIERDYMRQVAELERNRTTLTGEEYRKQLDALRDSRDEALRIEADYQARRADMESDRMAGVRAAAQDYIDAAADQYGQARDLASRAFGGIEEAAAQLVTTGKVEIKSLVTSIIADFAKMEARILASKLLQYLTSLFTGGAGTPAASGGTGGIPSSYVPYAAGGVVTSSDLSKHSGQVVSKPTLFAFAKGAGLMGEAGPEAIMPLRRGPDGKLGVAASGGSGGVNVNTTVVINSDGSTSSQTRGDDDRDARQLGKMIEGKTREVVMKEMQPGGIIWRRQVGQS